MKRIILLFAIFFSIAMAGYAQNTPCDPGKVDCRNRGCIPREQCPGPPPPPGLVVPIDSNVGLLLIAGLGLGIYFFVSRGKDAKSCSS